MKVSVQLKIEELSLLIAALLYIYLRNESAWWYLALFLAPDISMLGYLINNKLGAGLYNVFHSKAIGVALSVLGYFNEMPILITIGVVIFGHSAFDRVMGYGLKYETGFKFTHLGEIGNKKGTN